MSRSNSLVFSVCLHVSPIRAEPTDQCVSNVQINFQNISMFQILTFVQAVIKDQVYIKEKILIKVLLQFLLRIKARGNKR